MPAEPNSTPAATSLFNPIAFWADTSMTALETALSSTQNIGDGVDRMARASAAADLAPADAAGPAQDAAPVSRAGLELALHIQGAMFDLLSQAWQQWLTTLGTLASLGAGGTFKEAERQNPWLNTLREARAAEATPPERARSEPTRQQRRRSAEPGIREHAVAAAAPEPRSRAKPRTAARATGRSRVKR